MVSQINTAPLFVRIHLRDRLTGRTLGGPYAILGSLDTTHSPYRSTEVWRSWQSAGYAGCAQT